MKKLIFITLILFQTNAFSQKRTTKHVPTRKEKAEALVKNYLMTNLNDPHSYESVGFTPLDSVFNDINENGVYEFSKTKLNELRYKLPFFRRMMSMSVSYNDSLKNGLEDSVQFKRQIDTIEHRYKRTQIGWRLYHKFRGRNGFNALILQTYVAYFDLDISQLISIKQDD